MDRVPLPSQIEVVDEATAAILRTKTPAERVALTCDAHRTAKLLLTAQVQRMHPDWDELKVRNEVHRRLMYGTS